MLFVRPNFHDEVFGRDKNDFLESFLTHTDFPTLQLIPPLPHFLFAVNGGKQKKIIKSYFLNGSAIMKLPHSPPPSSLMAV